MHHSPQTAMGVSRYEVLFRRCTIALTASFWLTLNAFVLAVAQGPITAAIFGFLTFPAGFYLANFVILFAGGLPTRRIVAPLSLRIILVISAISCLITAFSKLLLPAKTQQLLTAFYLNVGASLLVAVFAALLFESSPMESPSHSR